MIRASPVASSLALDLSQDAVVEPTGQPRIRGALEDLDPALPSYPRLAAARIAWLADLAAIEAALAEVPVNFRKMVETLTVTGVALRIAQTPRLLDRRAALDALPVDLRERAEPHVRRLYETKPWLRRVKRGKG